MSTTREARLAEMKARRAGWTAPEGPRCDVADCHRLAYRAGRCSAHYTPLLNLVRGMLDDAAGDLTLRTSSRRAMAEMLTIAGVPTWMADDADFEGITDALYAAGYYVGRGPRGGLKIARRTV
jgi:hypothetical protein